MTLDPAQPTRSLSPQPHPPPATSIQFPPLLWTRLDPLHQQQLAQRVAELIRRIRMPPHCGTETNYEQS
jgi:hypothetical protein